MVKLCLNKNDNTTDWDDEKRGVTVFLTRIGQFSENICFLSLFQCQLV